MNAATHRADESRQNRMTCRECEYLPSVIGQIPIWLRDNSGISATYPALHQFASVICGIRKNRDSFLSAGCTLQVEDESHVAARISFQGHITSQAVRDGVDASVDYDKATRTA
jgi:hypothetical protein